MEKYSYSIVLFNKTFKVVFMKKKWLVCLLSMACLTASAFAFASCGEEVVESGNSSVGSSTNSSSSSTSEQTTPTPPQESVKSLAFEKITGKEEYAVVGLETIERNEVVIPSTYNNLPVTKIGDYAFKDCNGLTNIVIPDRVNTIGNYAFSYCSSLTIYCEAECKPDGWDSGWNYSNRPVEWGYKG